MAKQSLEMNGDVLEAYPKIATGMPLPSTINMQVMRADGVPMTQTEKVAMENTPWTQRISESMKSHPLIVRASLAVGTLSGLVGVVAAEDTNGTTLDLSTIGSLIHSASGLFPYIQELIVSAAPVIITLVIVGVIVKFGRKFADFFSDIFSHF